MNAPLGLRWRWWVLITFGLWVGAAAATLADGARAAVAGRDSVEQGIRAFDLEGIGADGTNDVADDQFERAVGDLSAGRSSFQRSVDRFESPVLLPLRPLPILGRQLSSARALSTASLDLVSQAHDLVSVVSDAQADAGLASRVEVLTQIDVGLHDLVSTLEAQDLGPAEGLVSPLSRSRLEVSERTTELEEELSTLAAGVHSIRLFLERGTYLVLGANPAEMEVAGGMPLSVGVLENTAGEFALSDFVPANALFPVEGVPVVDPDIEARWGFLSPSNDYRKLGYSARFSEWSAPQAIALWAKQTGETVDGVIQLDPFVMQQILGVLGGVEVGGQTFDQATILDYLLIEQYAEYDSADKDEQNQRRDRLAEVAGAVVTKLRTEAWDPLQMAAALRPMVAGRHLLLYSTNDEIQTGWDALGAAGRFDGNEFGVFLMNLTVSKTDPYVEVATELVAHPWNEGDPTRGLALDITIINRTPVDLGDFAIGSWEEIGLPERGSYLGRLVVYLPQSAGNIEIADDPPFEVFGRDGPLMLIVTRAMLVPGDVQKFRVEFEVPVEQADLRIIPSTRYPPQTWTVGSTVSTDSEAFDIPLADLVAEN